MADQEEYLYIIGVGAVADWEAGRGSLYYIEDKNGEKGVPVFTTSERAMNYARANLENAEAHMQWFDKPPAAPALRLSVEA